MEYIKWFSKTSSELFPGTIHKTFIINAPLTFQVIWKIIKQFVDKNAAEKTVILGKDYLKEMTKYMNIRMIPKAFGGEGIWKPRYGNVPIDFPFQMTEQ